MAGPLSGMRVVELQGRGPGPFGVMVLADLGADVVRVNRLDDVRDRDDAGGDADRPVERPIERMVRGDRRIDLLARGRRSVAIDLKRPEGVEAALRLVDRADVLVEGYRPGVAERLGLGPSVCLERNPGLVYARITGWGQDGPFAHTPGHDLNYVALAGALDPLRRSPNDAPAPPLNLLGDFGGGGMLLAVGILSALFERSRSGAGQVVDTAMVDGVALLTTLFHGMHAEGLWSDVPGTNVLDLGAPFYNVYETADARYVTIAAGEPQFYAELLQRLGLDDELLHNQSDPSTWPDAKARLAAVFKTKTRDEWDAILRGSDACYAPVLTMSEAANDPHMKARNSIIERDGVLQPAPAPRFSRSTPEVERSAPWPGQHTDEALADWGVSTGDIAKLRDNGAIA